MAIRPIESSSGFESRAICAADRTQPGHVFDLPPPLRDLEALWGSLDVSAGSGAHRRPDAASFRPLSASRPGVNFGHRLDDVPGRRHDMIVLIGYVTYIAASLVLGLSLVGLWRRTREWPELTIGLSFLLGGTLGYANWLAIAFAAMHGAEAETLKQIATLGLVVTILGTLSCGIGIVLIYRAGQLWATAFVACVGAGLLTCLGLYVTSSPDGASMSLWWTLAASGLIYGWGGVEAIFLGLTLRKRARLGMADPVVMNRTLLWGASSLLVVVCISINYASRIVYGVAPPSWTSTLAASALMLGAVAIWLGFFPPASYRARLERAFEAS
jgi:hypothetical protein